MLDLARIGLGAGYAESEWAKFGCSHAPALAAIRLFQIGKRNRVLATPLSGTFACHFVSATRIANPNWITERR
jgi:hypothetical protein